MYLSIVECREMFVGDTEVGGTIQESGGPFLFWIFGLRFRSIRYRTVYILDRTFDTKKSCLYGTTSFRKHASLPSIAVYGAFINFINHNTSSKALIMISFVEIASNTCRFL
jgi:hypothetical protein